MTPKADYGPLKNSRNEISELNQAGCQIMIFWGIQEKLQSSQQTSEWKEGRKKRERREREREKGVILLKRQKKNTCVSSGYQANFKGIPHSCLEEILPHIRFLIETVHVIKLIMATEDSGKDDNNYNNMRGKPQY